MALSEPWVVCAFPGTTCETHFTALFSAGERGTFTQLLTGEKEPLQGILQTLPVFVSCRSYHVSFHDSKP